MSSTEARYYSRNYPNVMIQRETEWAVQTFGEGCELSVGQPSHVTEQPLAVFKNNDGRTDVRKRRGQDAGGSVFCMWF